MLIREENIYLRPCCRDRIFTLGGTLTGMALKQKIVKIITTTAVDYAYSCVVSCFFVSVSYQPIST